jgi:acetyl esterase/lipase
MALRGYVAVSINYRLIGDCFRGAAPAGYDVRAAVRYVRSQAQAWNVDPDRVALMGTSAGAIAALRAAYINDDGDVTANAGYASDPQAVVSMSGVMLSGQGLNQNVTKVRRLSLSVKLIFVLLSLSSLYSIVIIV